MIINKFILHIFHCLVQSTWKPYACVSLQFFRRSRFTDENFLDFDLVARNRRRWNTTVSPTMNRNRLRLISSPPLPPFFPRLGIIFIKKNSRANLLPQKKRYTTLKKKEGKKEEVLSTVPRSPLQLCTWPRRDREHVPRAFISSCPRNNTTKTIPFFNVPISPLLERNTDVCDRFVEFGWLPSREEKWFDEILKKIIGV